MKKILLSFFYWVKNNTPLLGVILVALIITYKNVDVTTSYSGWDNIIAEFDLTRYARQVIFGAWSEHQSLGGPSAQGQLAEVTRLPFLFLFKFLLPDNLIRYAYIFMAYTIGGIGMYLYISKIWFHKVSKLANWLGFLGGIYYLLHVLTLQQFYISFEMFMAQFAFLPFLLILLHRFIPSSKKNNLVKGMKEVFTKKNILIFILLQFLISPSAHTQTVFYLGVLFSLVYMFAISYKRGFVKALAVSFLIGLMTLLVNLYWIAPNIYYGLHNAHYVSENRDNQLFGPESVGSVRDASTFSNLASGTQYLLNWKDYSFENKDFDFIFNEWSEHLAKKEVFILMQIFGVITLLGLFTTILDKDIGKKRFAIVSVYLFCLSLIWIDLFPTGVLLDLFYQNDSFLEAFRNPFTKLSIIYSFASILLFVHLISLFADFLGKQRRGFIKGKYFSLSLIAIFSLGVIYVSWPSFQGNFISEKLKVKFPPVYFEMFDYMKTRDKDLRVLQLPQLSHAGWEYYDWQFLGENNGYQGMGFYFFGFPQSFLNRDSDRWIETSDFFYHELKYALDKKDSNHLLSILNKYNVDLIIIDETKVEANKSHNTQLDHQLALAAGLSKVWEKDFLTIYERDDLDSESDLIIPENIKFVNAEVDRIRQDYVYQDQGEYVLAEENRSVVSYPFMNLMSHKPSDINFIDNNKISINKELAEGNYKLIVPGFSGDRYKVPIQIDYKDKIINLSFPTDQIRIGGNLISLPRINDFSLIIDDNYPSIILFFNNQGISLEDGQSVQSIMDLAVGENLQLAYANKLSDISYDSDNKENDSELNILDGGVLNIDWSILTQDFEVEVNNANQIEVTTTFPYQDLDILKNPSVNCSKPRRGSIDTIIEGDNYIYLADKYGVNCNGYGFEYVSSSYSYLLNLIGDNINGRGIKLFVNYSDLEVVPEDYLFTNGEFNKTISLLEISDDARDKFNLNWETRSFGKESKDSLSNLVLGSFPTHKISQIKLENLKEKSSSFIKDKNNILVTDKDYYLESIYVVDYKCQNKSDDCFLGIDQSYDDLWLSFKVGDWEFLPHHRYNNWANLWQVSGEGTVITFYLPELVSLVSLISLTSITLTIFVKVLSKKKRKKTQRHHFHKVKGRLTGKN